MKNLFISLVSMISFSVFSQVLNLSDIEYINPIETGSMRPRICLINGEPLVMFTRNSLGEKIIVNRKKDGVWLGENIISQLLINTSTCNNNNICPQLFLQVIQTNPIL